jgi:spermidine/putrescine-binding protein
MEIVMHRFFVLLSLALAPLLVSAEELIRVYNWNEYIAPEVLERFQQDTGIRVEYHTYSAIDELNKALASESIDVAIYSHDGLPKLIKAAAILPLDDQLLPNRKNLDKQLLNKLAAFDPQNRYALPYLWGAVGLAINTVAAEKAFGGPLPDSWSLLFDPLQSKRLASCGIATLDARDITLSVLMSYQGHSLAHSPPRQIKRAGELLTQLRPNLRYTEGTQYINDLRSGKICLALAWAGDALTAADGGQPVKFLIPQEGSVLFMDTMVIPKSSQRPDLAHRFINYLMQPEIIALISEQTLYPNGNAVATERLTAAERQRQSSYFDDTNRRRLAALEALPEKTLAVREEVWRQFMVAPSTPTP